MYHIGIDVGSTYTKYCVMDEGDSVVTCYSEKTPVRQREYFKEKIQTIRSEYPDAVLVSCGYGRKNIPAVKNVNELSALALGAEFVAHGTELVLDIGGQDTKIIRQKDGMLKDFFLNDKCAAGSGMFLGNVCNMLGKRFEDIRLVQESAPVQLSSVCAVFAQSEVTEFLADNVEEDRIIAGVIRQILIQSKQLLPRLDSMPVLLSGGLTGISGIREFAEEILCRECYVHEKSPYLSAIGCAVKESFN